jgi:phosphate transport system protein
LSLTVVELERLKSILIHMAKNIENILYTTKKLMEVNDDSEREKTWQEIENTSVNLETIRREFVNEVLIFIARRQPLGRELLLANALISIAYDMYRISRYCREIARIDSMLPLSSKLNTIRNLQTIFEEAIKAVEASLNDLIDFTPKRSNIVKEIDNNIDEIYREIIQEVTTNSVVPREKAVKALIMRHIERIVDHAQYIEQYLSSIP